MSEVENALLWHGVFGLSPVSGEQPSGYPAPRAIQDAFGIRPHAFRQGQRAREGTKGWETLKSQEIQNCGPHRDSSFLQGGRRPFLIVPLGADHDRAIGVVHVGLKRRTPGNPHGIYTEADEHLLARFQAELLDAYDRQRLRGIVQSINLDLHDGVLPIPYLLLRREVESMRTALKQRNYPRVNAELQGLELKLQSLMTEIQGMMMGLQSYELEKVDLIGALQTYLATMVKRPELKVQFVAKQPTGRVSSQTACLLYRIAQGALSNVLKWADATTVECRVTIGPTYVTLRIHDDGRGFDPSLLAPSERFGLISMERRAMALGGSLTLRSHPGQGTTVAVKVPRGMNYATANDDTYSRWDS